MQLSHFPLVPGGGSALRPDIVLARMADVGAVALSGVGSGHVVLLLLVSALLKGAFFAEHDIVPIGRLLAKHGGLRVLEAAIVASASCLNALVNHGLDAVEIDPGGLLLQGGDGRLPATDWVVLVESRSCIVGMVSLMWDDSGTYLYSSRSFLVFSSSVLSRRLFCYGVRI